MWRRHSEWSKVAKAANFFPIPLRMRFHWMVRIGSVLRRMFTSEPMYISCRDLEALLGCDDFATGAGG